MKSYRLTLLVEVCSCSSFKSIASNSNFKKYDEMGQNGFVMDNGFLYATHYPTVIQNREILIVYKL